MNWEMLSAIGQVIAAVGVIPSLIYLAIQIREQNKVRAARILIALIDSPAGTMWA